MKCIAYISDVAPLRNGTVAPVGLSNIYSTAQKQNSEYGITGLLSYREGKYIQVVEGEEHHVDQLYQNIRNDKRHQNVKTVLSTSLDERFFSDWDMKLVVTIDSNPRFLEFVDAFSQQLGALSGELRQQFEHFAELPAHQYRPRLQDDAHENATPPGRVLHLSAWPDFNQLEASPEMMMLCALLVNRFASYEELRLDPSLKEVDSIDRMLGELEQTGLLKQLSPDEGRGGEEESVAEFDMSTDAQVFDSEPERNHRDADLNTNDGFLRKMRRFLSGRI